jgi:Ser/Thr protein kinase RdoA (MazF antagonist)
LTGYREIRQLTAEHERFIEAFIIPRHAAIALWLTANQHQPQFTGWAAARAAKLLDEVALLLPSVA